MRIFHLKWTDGTTTDIHGTDIIDAIVKLEPKNFAKELESWEEKKEDTKEARN